MPNDVKAMVSAIVLIVAGFLAYWSRSPIRPDLSFYVLILAVFMVISMWVFPEAGSKKTRDETSRMKSGKLSFTRED